MTVSTDTGSIQYAGDGVTVNLTVPYYFLQNTDLKVVQTNTNVSPVVDTTLVYGTDYTVTGAGIESGGTVILTVPAATGVDTTITRGNMQATQLIHYVPNDAFPASTHEAALDKLTMLVQEAGILNGFAIQLPVNAGLGGVSNILPYPTPGDLLGWASDGSSIVNTGPSGVGAGNLYDVNVNANAGVQASKLSFLGPWTGAVARTVLSKDADYLSALDFHVVADGVTNTSTQMAVAVAAAIAAGKDLLLPAGTYVAQFPAVAQNIRIIGEGIDRTVVLRPTTVTGPVAQFSGSQATVHLEGITFNNNILNANAAHVVTVASGLAEFHAERCRFTGGSGFGNGLSIGDNTANRLSFGLHRVHQCQVDTNAGGGIQVTQENNIHITDNEIYSNGASGTGNGIGISYFTFPPVYDAQVNIIVSRNFIYNNGSAGCFVLGSIVGGTAPEPTFGVRPNANQYVVAQGNIVYNNYGYGLCVQADGASVVGNICYGNGNITAPAGSAYAGILCNSASCTVVGNVCIGNSGFGMDMGGSAYFTCSSNYIGNNAIGGGNSGFIGLNLGACQYGSVVGNMVESNGPSGSGVQIMVPGYDGGTNAFGSLTTNLKIDGNTLVLGGGSSRIGIKLYGLPANCSVSNNLIQGGTVNNAIQIQTNASVQCHGNASDQATMAGVTQAAAAGLVIPDWAETVYLTGAVSMTNIQTFSQNSLLQKVVEVQVTNGGSGYNPASPPSVTISGGGGTGATGVASVSGAGNVVSVAVTNPGSGFTSAPTVTFGSGSAAATAFVGCNNGAGRKLSMFFGGAVTLNNTNNIVLPTGTISAAANSVADFLGNFDGKYYLRSRTT